MKYLVIQPNGEMELRDAVPGSTIPNVHNVMGSTADTLAAEMVVGVEFTKGEGLAVVLVKGRNDCRIDELEPEDFA